MTEDLKHAITRAQNKATGAHDCAVASLRIGALREARAYQDRARVHAAEAMKMLNLLIASKKPKSLELKEFNRRYLAGEMEIEKFYRINQGDK